MRRLVFVVPLLVLVAMPGLAWADSPFDPAQASDIAQRVLLTPADMPGDGWSSQAMVLDSGTLDGAVPDTDACRNSLGPMLSAASKHPDGTIAGQAAETLSHGGGSLLAIPTEVALEIDVHEDDAYLDGAMDRTRDMLAGPDLWTCLGDLFGKSLGGALRATVQDAEPGAVVPNNGIARAVEITVGGGLVSLSVRMELYVWLYGNVVAQASVTGSSSSVTSDLAGAVINKTQSNLDREASKAP